MKFNLSLQLQKLVIQVDEKPDLRTEVLFNPNEITITNTAWKSDDNGKLALAGSHRTLSVTLFFDTTLPHPKSGSALQTASQGILGRPFILPNNPLSSPQDVRQHTDKIIALTEPQVDYENGKRPPVCQLQWGLGGGDNSNAPLFKGVLKSVTQTFSRFLQNGTPVRATLVCEFEEWEDPIHQAKKDNVIDDPIRIVKRGETLVSIAREEYGDPALWRVIADENHLTHPRQLTPGQSLTVPPLRLANRNRRNG